MLPKEVTIQNPCTPNTVQGLGLGPIILILPEVDDSTTDHEEMLDKKISQ